ncbi:MAG: hypothetical protein AAB901_00760, partial [Patescibacteria group bacterium]
MNPRWRIARDLMGSGQAGILFGAADGTASQIGTNAAGNQLRFNTTNTERLTIDSTGFVGVGSTTPRANFSVQGNALVSGNLSLANLTATGTLTTLNFLATNATTTSFGINAETFTDLTGTGLSNVGGALTLNATGDWTGTFDGQEGAYYLSRANHTGTQLASTISDFNSAVNSYINGSTTIAKTYTANTFTAGQVFSGGVTIATLNGPLQANNGVVSATSSIGVLYGGTGLTTAPSYGQILVGNSSGGYTLTATSSLGLAPAFTATYPIQYSGNVLSLAFGTTTNNTWSGTNNYTSTVALGSTTPWG